MVIIKLENLNFLIPLLTSILGILSKLSNLNSKKKSLKIEATQYKLKNIYSPLFQTIENYLYKQIDIDTAKSFIDIFKNIIKNHYEYIEPTFASQLNTFINDANKNIVNQRSFDNICEFVDTEFELSKKILKLPKRGILFKYYKHQLPKEQHDKVENIINVIVKIISIFILLTCLFLVAYLLYLFVCFLLHR